MYATTSCTNPVFIKPYDRRRRAELEAKGCTMLRHGVFCCGDKLAEQGPDRIAEQAIPRRIVEPQPLSIDPADITVTEQVFEPSFTDRLIDWVNEHPLLAIGISTAVGYGIYRSMR